jgi:radical SAM protein with 4Fe4S-binding SPASM domain
MSSNNAAISFVLKDMFYRRIKLAMLLFTCHGCSYRTLCSGRCIKVYFEETI